VESLSGSQAATGIKSTNTATRISAGHSSESVFDRPMSHLPLPELIQSICIVCQSAFILQDMRFLGGAVPGPSCQQVLKLRR
jgi:hypothetical protein